MHSFPSLSSINIFPHLRFLKLIFVSFGGTGANTILNNVTVSITVAALFSGIVAFGVVLLVAYFVRKRRISSNSDNGNGGMIRQSGFCIFIVPIIKIFL